MTCPNRVTENSLNLLTGSDANSSSASFNSSSNYKVVDLTTLSSWQISTELVSPSQTRLKRKSNANVLRERLERALSSHLVSSSHDADFIGKITAVVMVTSHSDRFHKLTHSWSKSASLSALNWTCGYYGMNNQDRGRGWFTYLRILMTSCIFLWGRFKKNANNRRLKHVSVCKVNI